MNAMTGSELRAYFRKAVDMTPDQEPLVTEHEKAEVARIRRDINRGYAVTMKDMRLLLDILQRHQI